MKVPAKIVTGGAGLVAMIIASVFAVEGGHVDNPLDPGGETHHGVTEKVAREAGYKGPMITLTKEQAFDIYDRKYITEPGFRGLVDIDAHVAEEIIDTGVNVGTHRPSCWFQETLNHLNNRGSDYPDVTVDCKVGPATVRAFEALRKRRGSALACELVVKLMDAKQAGHYMSLAKGNSQFEAFMVGWTRTRLGNVDFRKCS